MGKKTPLYDLHVKLKGNIVEFAGYDLPVNYEAGIIAEHNAVRERCGLFDVSHMGEFEIAGNDSLKTINHILTNSFDTLELNCCRYGLLLNDNGGIIDDLIVYRMSDTVYMLVVNASNREKDAKWIRGHLVGDTTFLDISDALGQIAIQGPMSEKVMESLIDKDKLPSKNYTFTTDKIAGCNTIISRTGYTGEEGFEIYANFLEIKKVYEQIALNGIPMGMLPCGLGSRDTLRFEACMPLYGHELNENFLASEVGLNIFIKMDKDEFIGKEALQNTSPVYKRIGLKLIDKGIAREGAKIYNKGEEVGFVTSGTFAPTLKHAYAMARVKRTVEKTDILDIDVRGKMLKAEIVTTPFYKRAIKA